MTDDDFEEVVRVVAHVRLELEQRANGKPAFEGPFQGLIRMLPKKIRTHDRSGRQTGDALRACGFAFAAELEDASDQLLLGYAGQFVYDLNTGAFSILDPEKLKEAQMLIERWAWWIETTKARRS